jgi:hypothetical protein
MLKQRIMLWSVGRFMSWILESGIQASMGDPDNLVWIGKHDKCMASPLQMLKQRIMLDPLADSCLEYLNLGFKLQWVTQIIWFVSSRPWNLQQALILQICYWLTSLKTNPIYNLSWQTQACVCQLKLYIGLVFRLVNQ